MPTLILSQLEWSTPAVASLLAPLKAARRQVARRQLTEEPILALLAQAARDPDSPAPERATLIASIAALSRDTRLYIAGSAPVRDAASGTTSLLGFLVSDAGELLLGSSKITPELVNGFDELSSALGTEAAFEVVPTPFGQIGLLPGEDIHFAAYARALAFHGAEIILNPSQERTDAHTEIRLCARLGRAGENCCYVATTSSRQGAGLYSFEGTSVVARADEAYVSVDVDLELLRRARVNPHRSLPAIVRANL
jgi:predicted amidohydrolase